jgi:cytochrome bd-type quinol oxidase subunit 2
LILLYTSWFYRVMRRKVALADVKEIGRSIY